MSRSPSRVVRSVVLLHALLLACTANAAPVRLDETTQPALNESPEPVAAPAARPGPTAAAAAPANPNAFDATRELPAKQTSARNDALRSQGNSTPGRAEDSGGIDPELKNAAKSLKPQGRLGVSSHRHTPL